MFRFTIRDVLWLMVVLILLVALSVEHRRLATSNSTLHELRAPTPVAAASVDGVDRYRVPVAGIAKGPAAAPITIVEFAEFQCPFSGRATAVLDEVFREYLGQVRLVFRHYPLPFHVNARWLLRPP